MVVSLNSDRRNRKVILEHQARVNMKVKHGQLKIIKLLIQHARTTAQKRTKNVDWLSLNLKFFMDVNKYPVHNSPVEL